MAQVEKKYGNSYLIASFIASLLFTASCVIRGIESNDILVAKGMLGVASLSAGLAYIVYYKVTACINGTNGSLPWY
jgi:hypothetical protein